MVSSRNSRIFSRTNSRSSNNSNFLNFLNTPPSTHYTYSVTQLPNGRYNVSINDIISSQRIRGNIRNIPLDYIYWIVFDLSGNIPNRNNINNNNLVDRFRRIVRNRGGRINGTINNSN